MAYPTREAVFSALFTKLSGLAGFTTWQRKAILPTDVSVQLSPILVLLEGDHVDDYDGFRLLKREWDAFIVIYFRKSDLTVPGATVINPLIDAVYDAMVPDDVGQNRMTLGNLVSWARIEGRTMVETGDTDTEGLGGALIPLKILVP